MSVLMTRPLIFLLVLVPWLFPAVAAEDELAAPKGMTVLTVAGKIRNTNAGDTAAFDLAMLERLGGKAVTVTDFEETGAGRHSFTGVPMGKLLAAVGADGSQAVAFALDGYERELDIAELRQDGVILAYKKDGAYLTLASRDFGGRGPLWLIYPLDDRPALRKIEHIGGRFVYQLVRLEIR